MKGNVIHHPHSPKRGQHVIIMGGKTMTILEELKRRIELKQQLIQVTQDDIAVLRGLVKHEEEKIKIDSQARRDNSFILAG